MKNKKEIEPCIHGDLGDCLDCNHAEQAKTQHTPTPWKLQYNTGFSEGFRDRGPIFTCTLATGTHVPESQNVTNAAFIVRAVNMHQALIDDCRSSIEWFEANGYPQEAANIKRLIAKAEGK